MLAHVPSFERNPRGSADFLAYPVPKACMHVLGTRVLRRLGVARFASSPKAAQALRCSLTPGLRISFGRVTCMARAAPVPGLWALGFLLWCGVCVWVRSAVRCGFCKPCQSWLGSWVGLFGHGLWCCPSSVGFLWCSWLGLGFGLLMGRVWFRGRPACPPKFPVLACGVGVCAGPGSRLCQAFLGWIVVVCFLRLSFCFLLGVPVPGFVVPVPPSPFFRAGLLALFFSFSFPFRGVCLLVSVSLFLVGRCFWLGVAGFGWVVPLCLFGGPVFGAFWGGFGRLWWCWRAVWWLWVVFAPPPPSVVFFFLGGGLPVPPSALPGLAHALARIQCCLPGCCCQLRSLLPCSGPMAGLGPGSAGWAAAPGGCLWLWVRGLGLFVSFPLCGAGFNLLGGPPPLLLGALWPRVWPAVLVRGVLVRRLRGCAVACFG